MASTLLLVVLAFIAGAASADNARIIGGSAISIETYPSVVQVETVQQGLFWLHQCGGTILNAIHVLSAAHCFAGGQSAATNRRIRAGTAALESGGVVVYIDRVFNHPTYGLNGNDGDITVIRTSSAFLFTNSLNSANFVAEGAVLPGGTLVTKLGWGSEAASGNERSPILRNLNTLIVDHDTCRQSYETLSAQPPVTNNMFCAGSTVADSCYGDGGGPVFVGNTVVGIISWGNGCLLSGFPGVSTFVSNYANWIVETVVSA